MNPRLLADENTSHHLVAACGQIDPGFPIIHISDWKEGAYLAVKDPALLMALRESELILAGFDRASMPMHAGHSPARVWVTLASFSFAGRSRPSRMAGRPVSS